MCNPNIKNRIPIIDLARFGTEARKEIRPNLLVGLYDACDPAFKEGDILDANATLNLIKQLFNNESIFEMIHDEGRTILKRVSDVQQVVDENSEDVSEQINDIHSALEEIRQQISELQASINNN